MNLLAVSDVVWQAAIGAIVTIVLAWMQQRTKDAVQKAAEEAAAKVNEVKVALVDTTAMTDEKLDSIVKTGTAIHTLVNSAMGEQKRLLAVTSRAKADLTRDPVDIVAAEVAEQSHREHVKKQSRLDARG